LDAANDERGEPTLVELATPTPYEKWQSHFTLPPERGKCPEGAKGVLSRVAASRWSYVDRHRAQRCCAPTEDAVSSVSFFICAIRVIRASLIFSSVFICAICALTPPPLDAPTNSRYDRAVTADYTYTPRAKGTSAQQQAEWRERYAATPDLDETQGHILAVVEAIGAAETWSNDAYNKLVRRLARAGHPILPKAQIRRGYRALVEAGVVAEDPVVLRRLRVKPTRTLSGVAPVTVLTKPFPCPGKCIFCPDDVRMPKSYLSNEPGAMRALMLEF